MRAMRISVIGVLLAAALSLSIEPAMAQDPLAALQPPPAGARYGFICADMSGRVYQEEYRVTSSSNDKVAVEVATGGQTNFYEKPVYAMGTTIATKEKIAGQERGMSNLPSSLAELRNLAPGSSYKPGITERRSGAKPIAWNYSISVLGRELAYHRDFGDLQIVVLNEDRWANLYTSTMQTHLALQLRFPVYWRYRDSNGQGAECRLASATGLGAVLIASLGKPAAVQTASAVAPARPPAPARATAGTAAAAGAAAKSPAGAEPAPQQRLEQLKDLLQQKLISQQEYDRKEREILGLGGGDIAQQLEQANLLYRQKKISQAEFVERRGKALEKIAPGEMSAREALVLLNQLLNAGLISSAEHTSKREQMLSAL